MKREEAIEDARVRYNAIKDKVKVKFDDKGFAFSYLNGLNNMTFNEYGRMCELGYIVNKWKLTKEDLL